MRQKRGKVVTNARRFTKPVKRVEVLVGKEDLVRQFCSKRLRRADKRKLRRRRVVGNDFKISRVLIAQLAHRRRICLAHKNDLAVLAAAKFKCGIDVEWLIERDFAELLKIFCTASERDLLSSSQLSEKLQFYYSFCAKEACIKLCGLNFASLKNISIFQIDKNYIIARYHRRYFGCVVNKIDNFIVVLAFKWRNFEQLIKQALAVEWKLC